MSDEIEIAVKSWQTGRVRYVPLEFVQSFNGTISRYGGYADFSLTTNIPWTSSLLDWISHHDQLEVYFDGIRQYRGYVTTTRLTETEPKTVVIEGYGAVLWARQQPVQQRWVSPTSLPDVSRVFAGVYTSALKTARGPGGVPLITSTDVQLVGVGTSGVDGFNRLSGDVLDDITNQTGNRATWGLDVGPDGGNRLYMRPVKQFGPSVRPDHVVPVPAPYVTTAESEDQGADVRNVVIVRGGTPQFPQLLHNGDFRLPVVHLEVGQNLLKNGDFEDGSFGHDDQVGTYWSSEGSKASVKAPFYDNVSHGFPYLGSRFLECDNPGEHVVQTTAPGEVFVAGHGYTLSFWAMKEIALQSASGRGVVTFYDASGTSLASSTIAVAPQSNSYEFYSTSVVAPAGTDHATVWLYCDAISPWNGNKGGLVFDDVQLYDASVLYQDGFEVDAFGASVVGAVDWMYTADPSPYSPNAVSIEIASASATPSSGADFVIFATAAAHKVPVVVGQSIRFEGWFKTPPGATQPSMWLELTWFRGDGSFLSRNDSTPVSTTISSWTRLDVVGFAPNNAASVQFQVKFGSPGTVLMSCLSARDSTAPTEPYLPEGDFYTVIACDDAGLASWLGSPPVYQDSRETYGDLCDTIDEKSVIRIEDAYVIADAFFTEKALSNPKPPITLTSTSTVFWPGELVELVGDDGPTLLPIASSIAQVKLEWDGVWRTTLEIEREQPDTTGAILELIRQQLQRLGPSGNTGGYYSSGSGATITTGAGATAYRTTLQASPTDATLHDDYTELPHVSSMDHDTWYGTTTEVVDARTSSTTTYGSLDARLDDMDSAISAAAASPVYILTIASSATLGGIRVGSGLSIDPATGILSASGASYTLPIASSATLGGIKVSPDFTIDPDGTLHVSWSSSLSVVRLVDITNTMIGSGLYYCYVHLASGALGYSLPPANTGPLVVRVIMPGSVSGTLSIRPAGGTSDSLIRNSDGASLGIGGLTLTPGSDATFINEASTWYYVDH